MPLPTPSEHSVALVTGASSGIGVEIARQLAARGHGLALVARREGRLQELAGELSRSYPESRFEVFAADIGDAVARGQLVDAVAARGLQVSILVNNAGVGGHSEFADAAESGRDVQMVRLNVEAVTDLMARYVPGMVERGSGAVINVASTAAFQPMPGTATYAATKAFVLSQSEAVAQELKGTGVTVTAVCPGPVKTEFADVAGVGEIADNAPEFVWTTAEQVARAAVEGADSGKRTVVPGAFNQAGTVLGRIAPRALSLPLIDRGWNR
jgi:short-subunit dehydrogenase